MFADRAQLVGGCAAVGSRVVPGCLLWHFKVKDCAIPGTHQDRCWVSLWDTGSICTIPSTPDLVARATRFLKSWLVWKESPEESVQCATFLHDHHALAPSPSLPKRCVPSTQQLPFPRGGPSVPCFELYFFLLDESEMQQGILMG